MARGALSLIPCFDIYYGIRVTNKVFKIMVATVDCPTCGEKVVWSELNLHRPFCSLRCKQIDLGAWAEEKYVIAAVPAPDDPLPTFPVLRDADLYP